MDSKKSKSYTKNQIVNDLLKKAFKIGRNDVFTNNLAKIQSAVVSTK